MYARYTLKLVTTAIVYPNTRIHIGWAWECLGSDWLVRSQKALGEEVLFLTGMDEHSVNVQKAAQARGLEPQAYCDEMAQAIEKVLRGFGMSYDRFIRTSDADHQRVVQTLVKRAFDNGDIYKSKYEGHYCESCEAYYTAKDLLPGGICPNHQKETRWISEENYFFKLSKYQDRLLKFYQENPHFLQPEHRQSEIINFIKQGLADFSISRASGAWGIPLPFDPKHVVYVWFDALINYVTGAGFEGSSEKFEQNWSDVTHIIGKDITRFHCIYWPAMLWSLNIPLPKRVFAHGWLLLKGEKLSKSSGNIITPDEVMAVTGPDPFRYYLLAENQFAQDGNFAWESLVNKFNADLANDWGNLVNRTISMTRKYCPETKLSEPKRISHSADVKASFARLPSDLAKATEAIDPAAYAQACLERSRVLNLYIDRTKPWVIAKKLPHEEAVSEIHEILFTLLEGIRWTATAFLPLLPFKMPEVFQQLGVPVPELQGALKSLRWGEFAFQPNQPQPIYPRIELGIELGSELNS